MINTSQVVLVVKNMPDNAGDRHRFDPWVRRIPRRRKWQQYSCLAGYSPWGHKESDMTETAETTTTTRLPWGSGQLSSARPLSRVEQWAVPGADSAGGP